MLDRIHLSSDKEPLSREQLELIGDPRNINFGLIDEAGRFGDQGRLAGLLQDLQSLQDSTTGYEGKIGQ